MKILVLLSRFPWPLDKGDKLRAYHQLVELGRRHEITLVALSHAPVPERARAALRPHCARVEVLPLAAFAAARGVVAALASGTPLQVGYFATAGACAALGRLAREVRPDVALCQLVRTAEYAGACEAPAVLDYMDAFSWGLEQRLAHRPGALRPLLALEAARLRRYESAVFARFAAHTVISTADRRQLAQREGARFEVVGNGVDAETFRPRDAQPDHDLLFVGNMAYPPNVLAAESLVRDVLPRLRARRPVSLLIAGTTPSARVRRLAGEGVTVTGWVDDIAACYARARVFVAPLPVGTGLQNKLLQALASALPCVTTPAARDALGLGEGEMAVGHDEPHLAEVVLELLGDGERARALGRRGREAALTRFRWSDAAAALERVLLRAAGRA